MITKEMINNFMANKRMAIAGVSRNPKKFGHHVYKDMMNKGIEVLPVNPNIEEINGTKCYPTIESLPDSIENLLILTPKNKTEEITKQAINKGIKRIWIQQMSETREALELAEKANVELIYKKCIYMFAEPVKGPHKLHRVFARLLGKLPK